VVSAVWSDKSGEMNEEISYLACPRWWDTVLMKIKEFLQRSDYDSLQPLQQQHVTLVAPADI